MDIIEGYILLTGMKDANAFLVHNNRIGIEIAPHHIFIDLGSLTTGFVDTLQFFTKPVEGDISTTNTDKLTFLVVDRFNKRNIMTADVGAIEVIIGV